MSEFRGGAHFAAYQRNFEAAFEFADLALSLDPSSSATKDLRGIILSYLGQTQEAIELMEVGHKTVASEEKLEFLNIGRAHFVGGDYEQAIPKLEIFAGLYPAADLVQFFLGNCYDATGQFKKARACVVKQLSLCPFTTTERISHVTPYPPSRQRTFNAFLRKYNVPEI